MTKRRRVIFVNRFFYPDESATSLMLTDLIQGLDREGLDYWVIAGKSYYTKDVGKLAKRDSWSDVRIRRVRSLRVFNQSIAGRLINFAIFHIYAFLLILKKARRGDIVICLTDPPLLCLSLALPTWLKGASLVNWVQDVFPEVAKEINFGGPLRLIMPPLTALRSMVWKTSAKNVVLGARMKDFLESEGVEKDRIAAIPNWCDESKLTPVKFAGNSIRRQWGFSEDDLVVMYSGNLGRAHEIGTMSETIKELEALGYEHFKFVFIGGGIKLEKFKKQTEEIGLKSVYFFEYQPRERLAESLSAANIHWISLQPRLEGLIVPSKFYGTCAVARPSIFIGANDGEIAKIIDAQESGWTFEIGQSKRLSAKLRELSALPKEIEDAGARARLLAEKDNARVRRISEWQRLIDELSQADSVRASRFAPEKACDPAE